MLISGISVGNLAGFKATAEIKQARDGAGLFRCCARLPQSPTVPVAMMMMVVMVAMVPTVPAIMVMMTVMPPVNFRRRQPRIFLNGRRRAGIAERHRIRGCGEREERADGSKSQNFRELHEISPSILCHVSAERLAATCMQSAAGDLNAC